MHNSIRKVGACASMAILLAVMVGLVFPVQAVQAVGPVTLVSNLQPSWTAAGGGGVFAAYYGPDNGYAAVSPGATNLYDGREAGIIKAGLTIDPTDHVYEDEGLLGFKPTVTINQLAGTALTYDVENQTGANPVWMTIEIDTGVVGDRSDNTTYQHVPSSNPAGWHTVDAGAGQWQKWDDANGTVTDPPIPLSDVVTAHSGRDVVRAYLRLGMGDSYHGTGTGTVAWVDKAVVGGVTYDFVHPAGTYTATPLSTDWVFVDDNERPGEWSAGFQNGPGTPALGVGSASIHLNSALAGVTLAAQKYQGTLLSDIQTLSYSTYTNLSPATMAFQINYDPDLTTAGPDPWYGRLVYEPYVGGNTITNGAWQTWDMINGGNGKWWASSNGNSPVDDSCGQATPCTWSYIIAHWPDIGIRKDGGAAIQFKAGSNWNGFAGNVDNLTVQIGGHTDVYDFELPSTVYVDDSWAGTTPDTDPDGTGPATSFGGDAFDTIQGGVDAVATGGTVNVYAGTYNEVVNIATTINLLGQAGAIIKPDNSTALLDGGARRAAIYINEVDGVTVDGFTIDGTGGDVHFGVYGLNSDNSVVSHNVIHDIKNAIADPVGDVAGVGIMFFGWGQGTTNATIAYNQVSNTGRMGIWVGGMQDSGGYLFLPSSANIHDNTVTTAWQGPTNDGGGAIQINAAMSSTIQANVIHDTGLSKYGVYIGGSVGTGNQILGNNIYNNASGIVAWSNVTFVAYGASSAGAPTAHTNKIHGNTSYGLRNVDTDAAYQINAEHNWWGALLGPTHSSNPTGTGDAVSNNVDFVSWCANEACSTFLPPFATTTAITSDLPDASLRGQDVAINFSVSNNTVGGPAPAGTVDISDGTSVICNDVALNSSGNGTCTYAFPALGNYTLTATYTPGSDWFTADSGDTESHAVVNAVPVITEGSSVIVDMSRNGDPIPFSLTLHATDVDAGDTLTWSITGNPTHGTASVSVPDTGASMAIHYIPNFDFGGWDAFVVQVSDGHGGTDTINVHVYVASGNHPPVITEGASVTVNMSVNGTPTAFSLTLHATDADFDTLTWSIQTAATNGTATASGTGEAKTIGYTPNANYVGTDSFVVEVTDGTDSDTIIVNVNVSRPIMTLRSNKLYDGWILEQGEFSSTGGAMDSTATTFRLGDDGGNRQYRSILSFGTGALPDNAVITQITLRIRKSGTPVGTNPFSTLGNIAVDIKTGTFGVVSLQLTDFQTKSTKGAAMTIRNTPVKSWYSSTLTTGADTLVNKVGNTQIRLRFGKDDNNNFAPDYLSFFSGNAGTTYRPQLLIEYYVPAP